MMNDPSDPNGVLRPMQIGAPHFACRPVVRKMPTGALHVRLVSRTRTCALRTVGTAFSAPRWLYSLNVQMARLRSPCLRKRIHCTAMPSLAVIASAQAWWCSCVFAAFDGAGSFHLLREGVPT